MSKFGIKADFSNTESQDFEKIETPAPVEQKVEAPIEKVDDKPLDVESLQKREVKETILEPLEVKKEVAKKEEPASINDEAVLNYLNTKGETKFESLDEYRKSLTKEVEKTVEKEVNPYSDVMDEEDKAYFNYKKETGRSRKEFDFLAQDFSTKSALDLAIEKVKSDTGLKLSNADAKEFLEKKLSIDLDRDELTVTDKIELNAYVKPYRDSLTEQQEKYRAPLEEALRNKKPEVATNSIVTPDGRKLSQEAYEAEIKQVQKEYIDNITKGVSSATPLDFNVEIDDNGETRNLNFKYDFSDKDRQSMLSDASDFDAMLQRRYATKDGFNHSQLAKDLWIGDVANQQKVIAAAMQQARADAFDEIAARDNNENFSRKPLPKKDSDNNGYGSLEQGLNQAGKFGVNINV